MSLDQLLKDKEELEALVECGYDLQDILDKTNQKIEVLNGKV